MAPFRNHEHGSDMDAVVGTENVRKRLFVFFDGTWQDGVNHKTPLTNVATLARCLQPVDTDGCLQVVHYSSGVGNVTSRPAQFIDAITGRGISAKIRNAYSFLSHNYNFLKRTDEIILVGFSRGAFAAQCLAWLISQTGLLEKQHLYYLRGLFTLWAYQETTNGLKKLNEVTEKLKLLQVLRETKITACAVWDTVSALGIASQPLSFVGKTVPSGVRYAYQALALGEERKSFKPCVWQLRDGDTQASQCWFLGSHGDVGGQGDAALGAVTLLWMIGKLRDRVGVAFEETEIGKHLKHKFLEWDFSVNTFQGSFKETLALSKIPHSGTITEPAWFWRFRLRARSIGISSTDSNNQRVTTGIHFTVRLAMGKDPKRYRCRALSSWTPTETAQSNKVEWHRSDGRQTLDEQDVAKDDLEYELLERWCKAGFEDRITDRHQFFEGRKDPAEGISKVVEGNLGDFAKLIVSYFPDVPVANS